MYDWIHCPLCGNKMVRVEYMVYMKAVNERKLDDNEFTRKHKMAVFDLKPYHIRRIR